MIAAASCESGSLASGHQLDHHLTGNRISDAKPAAEISTDRSGREAEGMTASWAGGSRGPVRRPREGQGGFFWAGRTQGLNRTSEPRRGWAASAAEVSKAD